MKKDDVLQQQEAEQILPSGGLDFVKWMKSELAAEKVPDGAERSDRQVGAIADMEGWRILKKKIEGKISRYRLMKDVDLDSLTDQDIGLRFRLGSLVAQELESIINAVEVKSKHFKEKDAKQR